uniref:Putative secreted salivary gland peptide n=1 Tax=Amblyomma aureolatum TaxID=187763 RepID=A0A1E1WZ32_9ACAR
MGREFFRVAVLLVALSIVTAQWQVRPIVSVAGNNARDFGANVGARVEGVMHKFPSSGAKIIGSAEASKSFGRAGGHGWNGPPQGQVGVRVELPLGRK